MADARTDRYDPVAIGHPGPSLRGGSGRGSLRPTTGNRLWVLLLVGCGLVVVAGWLVLPPYRPATAPSGTSAAAAPPFRPSFARPDGLITNEFAYFNPTVRGIATSPDWDVSSGSLFTRAGYGWTGIPDGRKPDATSSTGTDSSVFRMTTRRQDFRDVTVSLQLRNNGLIDTGRTPASDIDGVHVFLRYQNAADLYVVSLNRRDDRLVIKKKLPGGDEDGGHYIELGSVPSPVPFRVWQTWSVAITNQPDRAVVLTVRHNGHLMLAVGDSGQDGPVIAEAGAVGLRGDNCDFEFRDFRVDPA